MKIGCGGRVPHRPELLHSARCRCRMPVVLGHEGAGVVVEVGARRQRDHRRRPRDLLDHRAVRALLPVPARQPRRCARTRRSSPARCSTAPPACRRPASRSTRCTTRARTRSTRSCPSASSCRSRPTPRSTSCAGSRAASSTGLGAAIVRAEVQPGSSVVVVGAGGVGLSTMMGAQLRGRDHDHRGRRRGQQSSRRRCELGLATHGINSSTTDAVAAVLELTDGRGADYGFDAAGVTGTLDLVVAATRPGATCVVIGAPLGAVVVSPRHHRAAAPARAHRHLRRVDPPSPAPPRVRRPLPPGPPRPRRDPRHAATRSTRRRRRSTTCTTGASPAASSSSRHRELGSVRMTGEFHQLRRDRAPRRASSPPAKPDRSTGSPSRARRTACHADLGRRPPRRTAAHVRGPGPRAVRRPPRPRRRRDDDGHGVLGLRRPAATTRSGSTRWSGRPHGGAQLRAGPLRRDAARCATTSTPASATWTSTACTRRCTSLRRSPASPASATSSASATPSWRSRSSRAANDWHLEEWAGHAPRPHHPVQLPWLLDPELAARPRSAATPRAASTR